MTKNESKLLSIQGIAKASAFCLLLSAFSVNAAMAAPAPAGTVDEVMAVQQGKKVTGVVVDGTGEPVIGANVVVKGTTNGTITDFDGNYTIEGVPADGVLVISYIGYLSQEIPVGNQSAINVTLKEDTQTLDEVVVVGYGTMRKSDVTGSISTAKGEEMLKAQNFSALDNLRGKAAGVNIFSNSSQPGAYGSRVVIRGQATINASSDPLYVVDGVVMENFYLMNPNDIESMEVLKDASWFHWSGITPAISDKAAELTRLACEAAKRHGVTVSVDLNFRKKLWTKEKAQSIMKPLMQYVDVCIGNEEDAELCLGFKPDADVEGGKTDAEGYKGIFKAMAKEFGFKYVISTLRESFSATHNGWKAMIYNGEEFYESKRYDINPIIDRVGGGDSFSGGIIHGLLTKPNQGAALEFAVAASALKHTINGDFNLVSVEEVEALAGGDASGRVQR